MTVGTTAVTTETQATEPEEEVVVTHEDTQQVIQEMILYHGHYDRAADQTVRHLLKEMTTKKEQLLITIQSLILINQAKLISP